MLPGMGWKSYAPPWSSHQGGGLASLPVPYPRVVSLPPVFLLHPVPRTMFSPARLRVIYTYGPTTDPTTRITGCPLMILYLVRPSTGGIREHLRLLLDHFGQQYPVKLAGPRGGNGWLPVQPDQFLTLSGGFTPGSDVYAWWQCYRLLRALQPSLLHIHGFKTALVGCPAAGLARVPVLVTVHNFPAHRAGAALLPALSRLNGAAKIRFIAVSQALAGELSNWGIPAANITVIHNGIDAAPFEQAGRQRRYAAGDSEIVVGTVARMAPKGGFPTCRGQQLCWSGVFRAALYPGRGRA